MAEILGKDLDLYDDSMIAEKPFNLAESEITGPQFMTGADLDRSTRISKEWKDPVAIPAQASVPYSTIGGIASVINRAAIDSVANLMPNMANQLAQTAIETDSGKEKSFAEKLEEGAGSEALLHLKPLTTLASIGLFLKDIDKEEFKERAKTYDEVVSLLENRDYPSHKFAKRVIANTTSDVESRRMVRELYRQAGNIDSSKWYNQAGEIIGAMTPAMVVGRGGFGTARAFGAGRLAASRIAQNVAKGYIGAEMAGQYAEETAAQYLERTGDKKFENFTPKDATGLTAAAYGAIGAQIEFMGGVEPIFAGALSKVGLKSGLLKAGAKIGVGEASEEFLQGMTETLMRKIDGSSNKTWGEGFRDSLNGAAWGLFIGGSLGTVAFQRNRANLVKGIKQALPNVTDTQATQIAESMIESTAEISSQDPTLRANLREKVALMYRDSDIDNKENIIDATTDLEYGLIAMDSAERGIDIAENSIFAGEVNELGWFRDTIPENRRAEITALNDEIKGLKEQLVEENKKEEKNWEKIDEIENKLAQANQYILDKLSDLVRSDASAVRRMLSETEEKFVKREKERATKKAIKSGDIDVISDILSKAGFKTRDMSGTQIKELARLNWELLQDKDLGLSTSAVQRKMADVEANVESGNAVLLRAGYTQEMIDKMDDETWNRAILTQYRKEAEKPVEEPDINFDEIPDNFFQSEVFSVADENARLDDIYPAYEGETIEVDGKEHTVYNSNGDRIAKSKEALTNFWKWFGDSKVVDEEGRPLVVYHGTPSGDFDTFYPESYFTPNKEYADSYQHPSMSAIWTGKKITTPKTFAVYLKIEKPFTTTDKKAKDIFQKKYTASYSPYLAEDGNVDWMEAQDLIPYLTDNYPEYDGIILSEGAGRGISYVPFDSNQIKSVENKGTFSSATGNIYLQTRTSGKGKEYRGAYIPTYRFILRANKMDASTLSHELAHDWFKSNFELYRSGTASDDFMRAWGALETALGIDEKDPKTLKQASEIFARAYEAWLTDSKDWAKLINVDDKDRDAVIKLMQDYQNELRDIYNDINNPYFKETWGKLGELKPELKAWFDSVVNITDLDRLVKRGEMTEEEASKEKLNRAIDTVIENTTDPEAKQSLQEFRTLNDTKRYEVEGGNKNALQERLSNLAREIDENNMLLKEKYDTHRDMLKVAEAADNFVKTRLEDALAIINGEMAEVEGLYKEDIYTALERLAVENGDMNLISELKNSEIANRLAKELGQRVAGFRNFKSSTDIDVVSALKSLDSRFNEALKNKKAKEQFNSALDLLNESLENQDKVADTELEKTLKELECQ